jgi:UDP-glucose:(glucosyl)LPS alpha-1,2-glucosyltransferase
MVGGIAWGKNAGDAFGGTQLMGRALERRLPPDLLDRFQIHITKFVEADPGKIQIYWCHLTQRAPDCAHLANGGWRKFHRIVFVSNWQAQAFVHQFDSPWARGVVLHNAIEPLAVPDDKFHPVPADRPIRLIYTPVPGRGLMLLYHVFKQIADRREDVELDVFSSLRLYGQQDGENDENLFEALRRVPRVSYHGTVSNQQVRGALASSHIFVYPSIFEETSCICLIEAMSAGLACVHPNYGALYETAANWTFMYQWQDNLDAHAAMFYQALMSMIDALRAGEKNLPSFLATQKRYADWYYSWDFRARQWNNFLRGLLLQLPGG